MNDHKENEAAKNLKIIEVSRDEWVSEVLIALWKKMGIEDIEQ